MKIVLIGFMGSGKTSVANELSRRHGLRLIDTDVLVLEHSKKPSISAIFEEFGEEHFRKLEAEAIESIAHTNNVVIASGGGAILNPKNVIAFREESGVIVYLRADFDSLCKRLQGDATRPLFADRSKAKSLYESRLPLYEDVAEIMVDCEALTVEGVADTILICLFKQREPDRGEK